jgi:hypothetical protein
MSAPFQIRMLSLPVGVLPAHPAAERRKERSISRGKITLDKVARATA